MVGDTSRVTLNFDLSKIPFVHFLPGSRPIGLLTTKIKHVHLLVLIWERLQTPTTTTTTTPDTTVQPRGNISPINKLISFEQSQNLFNKSWLVPKERATRCVTPSRHRAVRKAGRWVWSTGDGRRSTVDDDRRAVAKLFL